jgi:hypothetical protein
MSGLECTTLVATIPEELTCFDVQERHGELTAKVGVAELRAAVEWLSALADLELRRQADV